MLHHPCSVSPLPVKIASSVFAGPIAAAPQSSWLGYLHSTEIVGGRLGRRGLYRSTVAVVEVAVVASSTGPLLHSARAPILVQRQCRPEGFCVVPSCRLPCQRIGVRHVFSR